MRLKVNEKPNPPQHSNCYILQVKIRLLENVEKTLETLRQLPIAPANLQIKRYDLEGKEFDVTVEE